MDWIDRAFFNYFIGFYILWNLVYYNIFLSEKKDYFGFYKIFINDILSYFDRYLILYNYS